MRRLLLAVCLAWLCSCAGDDKRSSEHMDSQIRYMEDVGIRVSKGECVSLSEILASVNKSPSQSGSAELRKRTWVLGNRVFIVCFDEHDIAVSTMQRFTYNYDGH